MAVALTASSPDCPVVSFGPATRFRSIAMRPLSIALLCLLLPTACSPITSVRGNIVEEERLAQVTPGASMQDVFRALGSPTVVSTFDENLWYYVGHRSEQTAFFSPEVVERRIVAVQFDDRQRVLSVEELDPETGMAINPVGRETPTAGRDLTFLEQVFGNFSR